jgi:YHS domain-containing protein
MEHDTVRDPVCGMRLARSDAAASAKWNHRVYHFCSDVCRKAFKADPRRVLDRFAKSLGARSVRIPIVGLACPPSDRLPLERGLSSIPGVIDVYVNPVDEAAYLTVDPHEFRIDEAAAVIRRFGARPAVTPS